MILKIRCLVFMMCYSSFRTVAYTEYDYEGSTCGDEDIYVCTLVTECPFARQAIMHRKPHGLQRCGFSGLEEVVCCPDFKSETKGEVWTDPPPGGDENVTPTSPVVRLPNISSKSAAACEEYSNEVPPSVTYLIIGGENATLGEYPHMAALGYEDGDELKWDCGGSLISRRYVLTAAHCIVTQDGVSPVRVRLGKLDLTGDSDNVQAQDYSINNITIHPLYHRRTKQNDIALIELISDVKDHPYVHPACLYQKDDDPIGIEVTGWGFITTGGRRSNILQKANLQPVSVEECNRTYQARISRNISSSQLCAGSFDGTKDTCQGDSGGPLQVQQRDGTNIYSIVGVTSYGVGCGGSTPGVYTRVNSFISWIEGIVWP